MKLTKLSMILSAKDAFVEELGIDPQFEGIEPEEALEALSEISDVLDAVSDENGISEDDDMDDREEEELLDVAEEASIGDEDEYDELHQSFIAQAFEAAEGKEVVVIEVGGPNAQINVNPKGVDAPESVSAPMSDSETFEGTPSVLLDGDELVTDPIDDLDEDPSALTASFRVRKAGKFALNSALSGKTSLKSIASAVRKPVTAHRITIKSSWVNNSPENKRAWAASSLRFASEYGHLPANEKEFGVVLLNALRRVSKPEGSLKVPFVSVKSSKSSAPFRALLLSRLRDNLRNFDVLTSGYADMSDDELDAEHSKLDDEKKKWAGTGEDTEGFETYKKALSGQKGISLARKLREGKGVDPDLNPVRGREKANTPWAMASLMDKYRLGKISNKEAAQLFSSLIKDGLLRDMGAGFQKDAKVLIAQGFISETGDLSKFLLSGEEANFPKGKSTKGKSSATLPDHTPELPGLPFLPSLLASSAQPKGLQPVNQGFDQFDAMMAFENGELDEDGVVELFSNLIKTGLAWQLQGFYGRTAQSLIEGGYLSPKGDILGGQEVSQSMQTILSAIELDDGNFPDGTSSTTVAKDTNPTNGNGVETVGGGIPDRRRVKVLERLTRNSQNPKGAKGFYGVQGIDEVEHTTDHGFGEADPASVQVDHVEATPLKVANSSVSYLLTPYVSVNSNFSVASKNVVVSMSKVDAAKMGLPINTSAQLFSAQERPDLIKLLGKGSVAQSFTKPRERTVQKVGKALIVQSSQFASVLIKAGLVSGTGDNQSFSLFRRVGDQYVTSSGHAFPVADGLRYGRPEFLVISSAQKQFFANQTGVKINSSFTDVLAQVDSSIFESTKKQIQSAEKENAQLRAKLVNLSSSFNDIKSRADRELQRASRQNQELTSELTAVRSSLTAVKLAQRSSALDSPAPEVRQVSPSPFVLSAKTFSNLAGSGPKA